MQDEQADHPATSCPLTSLWPGIYERGDRAAADALIGHARTCPSCRAEVVRLNESAPKMPGPVAELLADFARGLGVLGVVAAFLAIRGIVNDFNQAAHDMGLETPPWFRPIRPGPKEQGK